MCVCVCVLCSLIGEIIYHKFELDYNAMVSCLFGFYGISTFVEYLMPNLFLYKESVLFQTFQFSISIVFVHTQLNVKTVLFQTIQFSISTHFLLFDP